MFVELSINEEADSFCPDSLPQFFNTFFTRFGVVTFGKCDESRITSPRPRQAIDRKLYSVTKLFAPIWFYFNGLRKRSRDFISIFGRLKQYEWGLPETYY